MFRQLASLQTAAQPCHDAVVQRTANAAGKEQPTAKSEARFPGWLATVATCGASAGVYTFNSEDVPLTGRRQLLFRWPQSSTAQPNTMCPPLGMESYRHHMAADKVSSPLQQQALQLVRSLYQQASFGTEMLALHHPELQQRLSYLPKTTRLDHNVYDLSPQASFQTENDLSWYKFLRPTSGGGLFKVSVNSGILLQHASAEELVFIMGHELGHGIAKHVEERESWKVLIRGAVFGRLALSGISGLAWLLAIPAGLYISRMACKWVPYCLSQQHEHEADVLGAAIARAAGNSIEDTMTALARLHLDKLLASEDMYARSGISQCQADALASLQKLFLEVQLPEDDIEDSQGLTAFVMTMQAHLDSATDEEHFRAQLLILVLHLCVAGRRYCFHSDFEAMTSTHPCWLERIAYLKTSSTLKQLASVNAAAYPQVAANHLNLAKQLEEYQASPVWPLLVDFMEPKFQGSVDHYHKCISIRSRSQQSILLEVAEQSRKSYNPFAHAFGWVCSTVDHARK